MNFAEKMKMSRKDKVSRLVAICVKNNITPRHVAFADKIIRICASGFGIEKRTAKAYIQILISAWQHDKWKTIVETSPYLNKEEKQKWMNMY